MKFTFDSNILIRAMRESEFNLALRRWMRLHGPRLWMHQMALTEVLLGAADPATRSRWRTRWQAPAEAAGRMVVPDARDWDRASEVVAELRARGELTTVAPGFLNDCLIAGSCAREDLTLVTGNARDARRIAGVLSGFDFVAELP